MVNSVVVGLVSKSCISMPLTMATEALRSAVVSVVEDESMAIQSPRIDVLKGLASELLQKETKDPVAFEDLCNDLVSKLESICQSCSRYQSTAMVKTSTWRAFHQARMNDLPKLWRNFFTAVHMNVTDQLLEQTVNQKLFDSIFPKHFPSESSASGVDPDSKSAVTKDELNALQYVGGFIPHHLLKRFEKDQKHRYDKFFECLGDMAVIGESDGDVLDYTREWMDKVNRGGLFPLNNITFQMFIGIEKETRKHLESRLSGRDKQDDLGELIENIAKNDDVQWHWMLLSQSIDSTENSNWLLREIIRLYVTVRGFSMAASWMEEYKKKSKTSVKKATALRKHLS